MNTNGSSKNGSKNGSNDRNNNGKSEVAFNFTSILQIDVPQVRNGKHRVLVSQIVSDLSRVKADTAVRIPLIGLAGEKMQNVRSALNRVTRANKMEVATAADENYLYVWRKE